VVKAIYRGEPHVIDFVKFFLLYANVLKVVRLGVNKNWWGKQRKQLHVYNKASREAELKFWGSVGSFDELNLTRFKNKAHDLSVVDPFDSPLCRREC
jgi:hypothetical protein